jgi:hypothetical protein
MNITERVLRDQNAGMVRSMEVYSMVAFALFDGFTACWAEKFRGNLIRPVTYINTYIDKAWEPMLQTPPFPEHASGHSTITAAAAEVLTHHFGDVAFVDSTEVPFGWKPRSFPSFRAAAQEASVSRLYGGIHYRRGCDAGNEHGMKTDRRPPVVHSCHDGGCLRGRSRASGISRGHHGGHQSGHASGQHHRLALLLDRR